MRYLLLLWLVLGLAGSALAWNDQEIYGQGYQDGYQSGPGIDPIAPIAPIAPIRRIGETDSDYYLRGAIQGMKARHGDYSPEDPFCRTNGYR